MPTRGGAGRRGRGGRPMDRDEQLSRRLSRLLRHQAENEGLKLSAAGYVPVVDVLANRTIAPLSPTWAELIHIVATNPKQRFGLAPAPHSPAAPIPPPEDSSPADYLIRANQGHSISVESSELLTKIDAANAPSMCVHGTSHAAWKLIASSGGLKKMGRKHIHFSKGLPKGFVELVDEIAKKTDQAGQDDVVVPTAAASAGTPTDTAPIPVPEPSSSSAAAEASGVISGMRSSSTILIYIDLPKALEAGIPFWLSENGVLLSEGNQQGLLPVEFFKKVEDRKSKKLLVKDGVPVD